MSAKISLATIAAALTLAFPAYAADITPPSSTYTQTPSTPNGANGWYKTPVEFKIDSTDLESGVAEINYRVDSGSWQKTGFSSPLNLAPNASFEIAGATSSGLNSWEAAPNDAEATYTQDVANAAPGFGASSARVAATAGAWHGINHKSTFAVAAPYSNMSASVWVKTQNVTGSAHFNIYGINAAGATQLIANSPGLMGTHDWTLLSQTFSVTMQDAIGVYMDVGLAGSGTVWADAAVIDSSPTPASITVTVASDAANHRIEFYAKDAAGNAEAYSCTNPQKNCVNFKLDQTPPGGWYGAGAFKALFGTDYDLWVYTFAKDITSGLSTLSNKYQYHTERNAGFGRYATITGCSGTWQPDQWASLNSPAFQNGAHETLLVTPKTSFCNNNWRACKIVRFYAQDMAGNTSTKDFCINGPWVKVTGKAPVRSNSYIDMLAEAGDYNSDGAVEIAQNNIDFFTSSKGWYVKNAPVQEHNGYTDFWEQAGEKTEITSLLPQPGVFSIAGNFDINGQSLPGPYATGDFTQVVFVDGDLTISQDIGVSANSAALFIVSGDVKIAKTVANIGAAVFAGGAFYTAYNVGVGESTPVLTLRGLFSADRFVFQRSLQGLDNQTIASESFTYEPKYLLKLKDYLGSSTVTWKAVE